MESNYTCLSKMYPAHQTLNQTKTKQYTITENVTVSRCSSCCDADAISERPGLNHPIELLNFLLTVTFGGKCELHDRSVFQKCEDILSPCRGECLAVTMLLRIARH